MTTVSDRTAAKEERLMKAKDETQRLVQRVRLLVYLSKLTQREIERRIGFSRGYLSQLLGGTVEMKLWHLLAVLDTLDMDPGEFFSEMFPRRRHRSLEMLDDIQRGAKNPLNLELARLYGFGIESIDDFRERLERCEEALGELRKLGVLRNIDSE